MNSIDSLLDEWEGDVYGDFIIVKWLLMGVA
jgi:hypothetical protein